MENKPNPQTEKSSDIFDNERHIVMEEDHDGIRELDNPMPTWWTWFFVICVIFGYAYIFHYHTFGTGKLSIAEYEADMAQANAEVAAVREKLYASITPETVTAVTDPAKIASGKELFDKKCASCHGKLGEGGVGPNLTDNQWLHGCGIKNVFVTITEGVPAKGMISWKDQLNPIQIQEIASYILTLQPATGKAPEGEVCQAQ